MLICTADIILENVKYMGSVNTVSTIIFNTHQSEICNVYSVSIKNVTEQHISTLPFKISSEI